MTRELSLHAGIPVNEHATAEDIERHFRAVASGLDPREAFTVVSDNRTLLVAMVFPRDETAQCWIVWLGTGQTLQYLASAEIMSDDYVSVVQFGAPHRVHRNCLLPTEMAVEAIANFCSERPLRRGVWVDRVLAQLLD